jgi:hypothetical protein
MQILLSFRSLDPSGALRIDNLPIGDTGLIPNVGDFVRETVTGLSHKVVKREFAYGMSLTTVFVYLLVP